MSILGNQSFQKTLIASSLAALLGGCMGDTVGANTSGNAEPLGQGVPSESAQKTNAAPNFIITSGWDVFESDDNTQAFFVVRATDDDKDAVSFGLSPASYDSQFFTIDSATGDLGFREVPDFENPLDEDADNQYDITLTASDGKGGISEFDLSVRVQDESYEGPVTNVHAPLFFESVVYLDVSYDATGVIHTARAFDLDGDLIIYGLMEAGVDQSEYQVNHVTGEIVLLSTPNRNKTVDTLLLYATNTLPVVGNHTIVEVRYYDGEPPTESAHNPGYPAFTSAATVEIDQDPGAEPFYTAVAEDPDGMPLTYAVSSTLGNRGLLKVDPQTGDVAFANAWDAALPPTLLQLREMYGDDEYFILEADDGLGKKGFHVLKVVFDSGK